MQSICIENVEMTVIKHKRRKMSNNCLGSVTGGIKRLWVFQFICQVHFRFCLQIIIIIDDFRLYDLEN